MDVIALARELGAALQKDERYLAFQKAQQANENDSELNENIARIQFLQTAFQHEAAKEDKDESKLRQMDEEFSQVYAKIMTNPNMKAYEEASAEIEKLMKYINGIFTLCIQGHDPATCEPVEEQNCNGVCEGCSGCQ
ncbi:MAG: YlbF family regulator [Clostridia bacterium]|jgi:cell fate (sporulation/competence/biofilm development) regulator YlbF (YheA/YmcA/DUF963 family)|nr:YlbF family regulator [Clostridia bacterium]